MSMPSFGVRKIKAVLKSRMLISLVVYLSVDTLALADRRETTCYVLDEKAYENLDSSNLVLCMTSGDLKKYPHSIVTVTLEEVSRVVADVKARRPASVGALYSGLSTKIIAKRHFVKLKENEFGRKGTGLKSGLVFHEPEKTVFVGFVCIEGKTYFYKPFKPELKSVEAQR